MVCLGQSSNLTAHHSSRGEAFRWTMAKQNATVRSSAAWGLKSEVVVLDEQFLAPEAPLFTDRTDLARRTYARRCRRPP